LTSKVDRKWESYTYRGFTIFLGWRYFEKERICCKIVNIFVNPNKNGHYREIWKKISLKKFTKK
jgi:hypothetical protein